MTYGKLENGYIRYAPKTVTWQGHTVNNPDAEKLKELGYLPIRYVDMPTDAPDGKHYESGWEQTEDSIVQTWTLVEDEPVPEPPPTIEEQIAALQRALISQKIVGGTVNITDSSENKVKDVKLFGNSEQTQDPPPSPENPQPIRNVGKYNEETGKYEVDVKVTGKNLFDVVSARNSENYKMITASNYTMKAIEYKVVPNTDYILSVSGKASDTKINLNIANTNTRFSLVTSGQTSRYINSLDAGIIYVGFTGVGENDDIPNFESEYFDIQLEIGMRRTEYESYSGPQTLTLTSDRQLTKWDKLVEQDGQIGWLYGSKKATFENAVIKNVLETNSTKQFSISYEDVKDSYSTSVALCNLFAPATGYELYTQSGKSDFYMGLWNKSVMFSSKKLDGIFQTKESFQEWLRQSELYIWIRVSKGR